MKYKIIFHFFIIQAFCWAQIKIQVLDFDTGLPVEKVKFYSNKDNSLLAVSDNNGYISLVKELNGVESVLIKADGYIPKYDLIGNDFTIVYLESKQQLQKEESDAEKIILKMLDREKINNPHSLSNYKFNSYSKVEIDADSSSISYIENPKKKSEIINNHVKKLIKDNMFFIAERAMIHKYDKKFGEKNSIVSTTISGIKNPIYELIAKGLMFNELPRFLEKSKLKFYRFKLIGFENINGHKTYKVAFYLRKQYNEIVGSNGILYIDTESFALVKYTGIVKDNLLYNYFIEREAHSSIWFTKIENVKIFFPVTKILNKNKSGAQSWVSISTVYSDFEDSVSFKKEEFFGYEYDVKKDFWKNEEVLSEFRTQELTTREENTYKTVDSLTKKYRLVKKIQLLSPIMKGELKMNKINFDLYNSLRFNDYEGFRFQASGRTNYDFSKTFALRGFVAWATKDQKFKFGGGTDFFVNRINNGKLSLFVDSDVQAAGKNRVREYEAIENIRDQTNNLSNNIYYKYKKASIAYQQDFFDFFTASFLTEYQKQQSLFNYSYKNNPVNKWYKQFDTSIRIKFTPFVNYMKTPIDKIAIEDNPPYFFFNYTRSWNAFSSDFEYNKFDFTSFVTWDTRWGKTKLVSNAGYIDGKTTLMNLYEGFGVVKNGSSVLSRFELRGYNTFETVTPGSFFASKYAAFFLSHTFKDIRVFGHRYLHITLAYNGMIGNINNKEDQTFYKFTVPDRYYQEVGIEFNKLISIFGLGAYYRIGAFNTGTFDNNLYIKLTYTLFK